MIVCYSLDGIIACRLAQDRDLRLYDFLVLHTWDISVQVVYLSFSELIYFALAYQCPTWANRICFDARVLLSQVPRVSRYPRVPWYRKVACKFAKLNIQGLHLEYPLYSLLEPQ